MSELSIQNERFYKIWKHFDEQKGENRALKLITVPFSRVELSYIY